MISTPCFPFSDRKHIHRVLHELRSGNSLYADRYTVSMDSGLLRKDNHQAVCAGGCRPTLTTTLSSTKATFFHRWLMSTSPGIFVEHLSDITLDCREANCKVSASLHSNKQQILRLKHAVWSHGSKCCCKAYQILSKHTSLQCLHCQGFPTVSLPSNDLRPHTSTESGNARSQQHRAATVVNTRWRSLQALSSRDN
jgi:hypothetical protein